MEGLGYWVFLLILYGLSALLKKRRQTVVRHRPEPEKRKEPPPRFRAKEDILKELFGGSLMEEPEPAPARQQEPEYPDQEPLYGEEPKYDTPESTEGYGSFGSSILGTPEHEAVFDETVGNESSFDSTVEPTLGTVYIPGKEEDVSGHVTHTTARKQANPKLVAMLKNKNALKYSFMLREVLDKPRSARRNIR